jgi:hypothetical protein
MTKDNTMKTYILDDSGVVVNIILTDGVNMPELPTGLRYSDEGGPIGSSLIDGEWVEPQEDPEQALKAWRETASCTRAQGKLAIGPVIWGQVVAMLDDPETPWGLRVAVEDTSVWYRNDEDMAALIWAMGLAPEQADDLFRLAATL